MKVAQIFWMQMYCNLATLIISNGHTEIFVSNYRTIENKNSCVEENCTEYV